MHRSTRQGLAVGALAVVGLLLSLWWAAPTIPVPPPQVTEAPPERPNSDAAAVPVSVPPPPPAGTDDARQTAKPPPTPEAGTTPVPESPTSAPREDDPRRRELEPLGDASVSGRVLDEHGSPLAEARVNVRVERFGRDLKTDALGHFEQAGLPAGELTLFACYEGLLDSGKHTFTLGEDETLVGVVLVLTQGLSLRGRVFANDTGLPVAGAFIDATLLTDPTVPVVFGQTKAKTDAAGEFTLPALMPGAWGLEVRKRDAYLVHQCDILVSGDDAPLAIGLDRGVSLTGTVLSADGAPVQSGEVRLTRGGTYLRNGYIRHGEYATWAFEPSPEPIDVVVECTGAESWQGTLASIEEPGVHHRDFQVERAGSISGWVVDELGEPVSKGTAVAYWRRSSGPQASLDANGAFHFPELRAGEHYLVVHTSGKVTAETAVVDLAPGEDVADLVIRVHSPTVLELVVTGCTPGSYLQAKLRDDHRRTAQAGERVGGDTQVVCLTGPIDGAQRLWVRQSGDGAGLLEQVELSLGETRRLERRLEPAVRVAGRVVFDTVRPAYVRVDEVTHGFHVTANVKVAADGTFSIQLLPGSYTFQARGSLRREGPLQLCVVPEGIEQVELELPFP